MPTESNSNMGIVPKNIEESWKRCYLKGLTSAKMEKDPMLGEYELKVHYDQYSELIYYSSSIMKDVYKYIQGTEFLLLIATPEGYIIDTIGDPSFVRQADHVSLRKGANWLEDSKGTNAIGTAIIEKKPVLVQGSQHFCKNNHFLTCAASPIFDTAGQLLGILNLSSYQQNYHPITLGLVKSAAHRIEQSVLLAHNRKISNDLDFIYNHHPSSLITIDMEGKIKRLNYSASRTIGGSGPSAIGKPISRIIAGYDPLTLIPGQGESFTYKDQIFTTHIIPHEDKDQACVVLRGEQKKHSYNLTNRYCFSDILSNDPHLNEIISVARKLAELEISLLITGETGTGKELFAQSIHGASFRNHKPFVAINCSAIPEGLLESELFGYEKGAFTGAKTNGQIGKFEVADGGTLFLDEIGDMSLAAQAALLRVVQEGCITRIGSTNPRTVDVRIIAATHKDLTKEIEAGRFRADLYYRLNGFTLRLPSLRNRTDLLLLAEHILSKIPFKKEKVHLSDDAKQFIVEYGWGGNFRQLNNVLQQAAFLANHNLITKTVLLSLCPSTKEHAEVEQRKLLSLQEYETNLIKQVLEQTNGNISRASKQLNIGRNTLYRKLKEYNIRM